MIFLRTNFSLSKKRLAFPRFSFSTSQRNVTFLRHARSQFNDACQQFRIKNKIAWDWNNLIKHPEFANEVAFNSKYMDCRLCQVGIKQAADARHYFENQQVDIILVSPQQRALQTCHHIFRDKDIPVKVLPILTGPIWSVCDLSIHSSKKKKHFPDYDFSELQKVSKVWYLEHLTEQHRNVCLQELQKKTGDSGLDTKQIILQMLRQQKIIQTSTNLRRRTQKFKTYLSQMDKKLKNVVVISHYYKIQYLLASQFSESDEPLNKIDILNCTPYKISMENLNVIPKTILSKQII